MPIKYYSYKTEDNFNEEAFKLSSLGSTYIINIIDGKVLQGFYGGIAKEDPNSEMWRNGWFGGSTLTDGKERFSAHGSLEPNINLEFPGNGALDVRVPAVTVISADGTDSCDYRYESYEILEGKPEIYGLPSTFANEDEAETLILTLRDSKNNTYAHLYYTVFEDYNVITKSVRLENKGAEPVFIDRLMSACVHFDTTDLKVYHLDGKWAKERTLAIDPVIAGNISVGSREGKSSHRHNPFIAIGETEANEDYGMVYGFNFVYSGNFLAEVEGDENGCTRMIMGIHPDTFRFKLESGESFSAPEVVMVYSDKGVGEMSRTYHKFYAKHLIRSEWQNKKRPILINSWEGTFFDFNTEKLINYAKGVAKLGVELLVMDDGWFGHRDSDDSSLGDWFVYDKKVDLHKVIDEVNKLGMKFGIWFEPEMISPDSELFRAHPDWYIGIDGRDPILSRHQLIIDMTRKDVRDNIFEQMCRVMDEYNIEYIKWDFNRPLAQVGSKSLPADRQGEVAHRFILGTYELMERFCKRYPHVLFENCTGGGGRFDPAMLYYAPQIWASDCTDAIERLTIQFGTSLCYPVSTISSHVSCNNRTGLETRGNVALCGTFGYELDPDTLTDDDRAIIKKQVEDYNKYYWLIRNGDFYRLEDATFNRYHCSWGFVNEDKSEALFTYVAVTKPKTLHHRTRLKGLDSDKLYKCKGNETVYSGRFLMEKGVNIGNWNTNHESNTFHFTEVK